MTKDKKKFVGLLAAVAFALAGTASADTIYNFTTGVNGNANQSANATFDFSSATAFTLKLTNIGNIIDIASVLDDFSFNIGGTFSNLSLNTITGGGFVDCTASDNTTSSCSNNGVLNANGKWSSTVSANNVSLVAGVGEHPYGIVNNSIFANGNLDGLRNGEHNPYILGPVTFSFSVTETSIPTISNVVFSFGTKPDFINGVPGTSPDTPLPEPESLALLAIGLLSLGLARRKNRS